MRQKENTGTPCHVILGISKFLPSLTSCHLSKYSSICFMYNVWGFQLHLAGICLLYLSWERLIFKILLGENFDQVHTSLFMRDLKALKQRNDSYKGKWNAMILLRQKRLNHREDEDLLTQHELHWLQRMNYLTWLQPRFWSPGGQNHTISISSRILSWAGTIRFPVATCWMLVLTPTGFNTRLFGPNLFFWLLFRELLSLFLAVQLARIHFFSFENIETQKAKINLGSPF